METSNHGYQKSAFMEEYEGLFIKKNLVHLIEF